MCVVLACGSEALGAECRGWAVGICRDSHTSVQAYSCKPLLGDCQGTGPQEHKAGPSWNNLLSPPRKYMKWEGSGESGRLKELVVGKGSFLERGGNGFAKLGNWRKKRTKQPFGNFEFFFPVGYFFSSLVYNLGWRPFVSTVRGFLFSVSLSHF